MSSVDSYLRLGQVLEQMCAKPNIHIVKQILSRNWSLPPKKQVKENTGSCYASEVQAIPIQESIQKLLTEIISTCKRNSR